MSQARRCFGFEADFVGDLRCIPMAVRRKLDLAGVKLRLSHWGALEDADRQRLLDWDDGPEAIERLRAWLLERTAGLADGPARTMEPAAGCSWQQAGELPGELLASCAQLGLTPRAEGWAALDELQRFALVKLSHPGHEHRNLPRALAEFSMLADPDQPDVR
jgi:hypothetical protein